MSATSYAEACVAWALRHLGDPYVWAGQGEWAVRRDAQGQGQIVSAGELGCPGMGFDCAGLVKRAHFAAAGTGAVDLRSWWSASDLFWHLPEAREGDLRLVFYGQGDVASHIEFDLGNRLRLGANGGDSTTLTYMHALHRNAKVRIGFEGRGDRIGFRSLDALRNLPLHPPPRPTTLPAPRTP